MPTFSATISIATVGPQTAGVPFTVTGTIQITPSTWDDELIYVDNDSGIAVPIAAADVQFGVSSFTFTHPGLPAGTHSVSVKDLYTGVVATSNFFVVAGARVITPAPISGAVAGVAVPFTGALSGYTSIPSLTFAIDGGQAQQLLGVSLTGWTTTITFPTSGSHTVAVSDGALVSPEAVTVAPVSANHVITPNPPTPVAGPNYILYDTFTSLADVTDTGGQGLTNVTTISATPAGQTLTDTTGGVWTIVGGVIKLNGANAGFSQNVTELALVNGVIWQENASAQWYSWQPPSTWNPGNNPLIGGTTGSWMNHYPFGGSEYTLSANDELEYFGSTARIGWSPFSLQNNGLGPGLVITADTTPQASFNAGHSPSNPLNLPYNSGVIVSATETSGEPTPGLFSFTYGLIEVQALFPAGSGYWPGIAMYRLGTTAAPGGSGELDIVECGGGTTTRVFGSIHSSTIGQSAGVTVTDYSLNRHIYGVNWQPDLITWYVDGNQYAQVATPSDFIGNAYYIAIDLAIQGNVNLGFDGIPTAATPFPGHMLLDFVRVSQGTTTGSTITAGALVQFTGSLLGYAVAPSLTYSINNAPQIAMTGVTTTGWSMQFNAPTVAGVYQIAVSDGTVTASTSFQVGAAALAITVLAPNSPVAGQSFTFTGLLAGYTTVPALSFTINGGASSPVTGVTTTGWAMTLTIATAGSYTITVSDGNSTAGSVTFVVVAPNTSLRTWWKNWGQDGSFWVQPFYSSALWIQAGDPTFGSWITALRQGGGSINLKGNFSCPFYVGQATDPLVTVTDGVHTIVVHIPVGAVVETPLGHPFDQSIGGVDATQPYLVWSISGCTINTGSVAASGSVITGTYGLAVCDGSGLMMVDAVTGQPGDGNAFGLIQDLELAAITADPNYVIQHMLTCQMDPSFMNSTAGPCWPLKVIDTSAPGLGPIPQFPTLGIPASVGRPQGKTRGFYALWDQAQQYGLFPYNVAASGSLNISIYDSQNAHASLVADMVASWPTVVQSLCILHPGNAPGFTSGPAGSQFNLATTKGFVAGATPAFTPPPPLDLSPTGGVNVAPSTFGAWYPSGYNATPTNTPTTQTFSIAPLAPTGAIVNVAFTFTGSLGGYSSAPSLNYSLDGGSQQTLAGVTSTGWSASLTIATSGTHTIVVTDNAHGVSGTTTFNVSSGVNPPPSQVTWNPSDLAGGITLSNNNYTATATGSTTAGSVHQGVRATTALSSAKPVLFEITGTFNQDWAAGAANTAFGLVAGGGLGADNNGIGFYPSTGTGSQPPQTVYYGNAQLSAGNGQPTANGSVVTFVFNGTNMFASDPAMRSTAGVNWNSSTTANPVTNVGGFAFAAIGATYFPCFSTLEGGGVATLNDGSQTLSAFAAAFLAANPSVTTLSGQTPPAGSKTITPNTPSGVTVNTPFTFTGSISGYATTPNLTYTISPGGSQTALAGVTASGWSTTLTLTATGTYTITVSDGVNTGTTASFSVGTGGTLNRVVAPLTGSVTAGTWQTLQTAPISTQPFNGSTMQYNVLLPAQYNSNLIYPLVFVGHPDFDGMNGSIYRTGPSFISATAYVDGTQSLNSLFNTVAFRTAFPCILIAPQCWQPGSDQVDNFGGYGDSQNSAGNEQGVNTIAAAAIAGSIAGISPGTVDPQKRLLIGYSLGAIGVLAWLVDNNQFNGPSGLNLWTAAIGMSDQLNRSVSNTTLFGRMASVPYLAISTTSDNVPASYDQPAWQSYTGNTNYPTKANYDSGGMPAIRAGTSQFYYINYGSANPTNPFMILNSAGGDGTTMYTWLFAQLGPGASGPTITGATFAPVATIAANSAVGTVAGQITAASANGSLTGISYSLSSTTNFKITTSGQVQFNSTTVAAGSYTLNVTVGATNASNSPQTYGFTIVVTGGVVSGQFSIDGVNGRVLAPDGTVWTGRGVSMHDSDVTTWIGNAACQPLTTLFPGINIVRIAAFSYWSPATYQQQINWMTAAKIVVVLEDHTNSTGQNSGGAVGVVYTGTLLSNELAWYTNLANAFKTNTYVWYGTDNEPAQSPSLSAMYTWQQQTYNAIRATGAQNIIELETPNPFQQGARGSGIPSNLFSTMHNIVIGPHYYSWIWNGQGTATSQATIFSSAPGSANSQFGGIVQQVQNLGYFTSADGKIPVGCFECGPTTTGNTFDAAGFNCVAAVFQAVTNGVMFCFTCWAINTAVGDLLNNGTTALTSPWGTTAAAAIAANNVGTQATRARDVTKTFAVQSKTQATTAPTAVATILSSMSYLNPNGVGTGVGTVRFEATSPAATANALGQAGYKLDIFGSYNSPGSNSGAAIISALQPYVNAGYVAVIEGPLEVDNTGFGIAVHPSTCSYTALNGTTYTGWNAAVKYQQDLYTSFNGKPGVKIALWTLANPGNGASNSPAVAAASSLGLTVTGITNLGNVHFYEHNGNCPATEMSGVIAQETGYTPGLAFIVSESGFNTDTSGSAASVSYYGNPTVNAKYTLNLYFDAYKRGCALMVYYELYNESPPAVSPAFEGWWGLFDVNANPQPAATALRNLLTVIGDAGSGATTFAPGKLNFTVSGLGSNGNFMLMQRFDGTFCIVIWVDANIFTNGVASTAPNQAVTVTLGQAYNVAVFDPLVSGTTPIKSASGALSVAVTLTDHPIIVTCH